MATVNTYSSITGAPGSHRVKTIDGDLHNIGTAVAHFDNLSIYGTAATFGEWADLFARLAEHAEAVENGVAS